MIIEKDLVTKKYLKSQLDPIKNELVGFRKEMKGEIGGIHGEFAKIRSEMKEQKMEIIEKINARMFEVMQGSMEIMKSHYEEKTERYIGAVIEGMKDDNRGIRDGLKMLIEKTNNHEKRLQNAGL